MIINDAKYLEQQQINVMLNTGVDDYAMLEHEGLYAQELADWVALGNTITPYDAYYHINLQEAYSNKEQEIITYGDALINGAYANPEQGVTVNFTLYKSKVNRRKSNKADKLASEIVLTTEEKDEAKVDEKLSEYEVKISNDQDKAITNLYKLNTVTDIMTFDVQAENWNVWVAPV